jgi:hypothetical protein
MITPKLSLDFTSATLDPRITFARSGATATRVNSSGLIESVVADTARFDYSPITLGCKGLLVEDQKSNAYPYSSDLTQATAYTYVGATIGTAAVQLSPDGISYMQKLEETSATSVHRLQPNGPSVVSGTRYVLSFFAKKAEREFVEVQETSYTGIVVARFNLTAGTYQTFAAGVTANIEPYQDGVYRCWVSMAAQSTGNPGFLNRIQLYNGSASSYAGTTGYGAYLWGLQFETGFAPTSYIPTAGSSLTRNADVATITGTNFSSFWQAGRGGVLVRALPSTVAGIRPLVQFDDNTADNIIALRGNTTNPELYIVDGGTPQAQLDAGTIAANTAYSLTGWWATNDCKARKDAGAVVTDTTAAIPTVTQMRIGSDGTNYLNGTIATINYYDSFFGQPIYTRRKNKVFASLL